MATTPKKREPARVVLFYGAKGGVGTTTIAINAAIALHKELGRSVCLIDANLQFGDHRVFLDLGLDRASMVDLATAPAIDVDLIRHILVKHESGIELLLAPPSPETAELVTHDICPTSSAICRASSTTSSSTSTSVSTKSLFESWTRPTSFTSS